MFGIIHVDMVLMILCLQYTLTSVLSLVLVIDCPKECPNFADAQCIHWSVFLPDMCSVALLRRRSFHDVAKGCTSELLMSLPGDEDDLEKSMLE
jgi:hypothetical protein